MASLDEELQQQAEEEQRKREEFEQTQQQERLRREQEQNQRQNLPGNQLKNVAKDQAKKLVKKQLWKILLATWEVWVPALLILAGLALVLFVVIVVPVAVCNSSVTDVSVTGLATTGLKATFAASGICSAFKGNGGASGGGGGGGSAASSDVANRAQLAKYGITVNKANCTSPGQTNCTSLDNMNQSTLDEIISVALACDARANPAGPPDNACGVIVTGGTEAGHAETGTCTHANGYKFDMSLNNQINSYVRTFKPIGNRGSDGAPQYRAPDGSIYAQEGDHWDVVVGCS